MQEFVPTSSGMVIHSAENPEDEIPVGPQIYPYGTPQQAQSTVGTGLTSEIPTTGGYQVGGVQTRATVDTENLQPEVQYDNSQYETTITPQVNYVESPITYNVGVTGYQEAGYNTLSGPMKTITRYEPVTSTVMVPQVTTRYVAMPSRYRTGDTFTPPPIPTPELAVQQPLYNPDTVPLPAPIQAPFAALPQPKIIPVPPPPPPVIDEGHYVSNYPIYETDPRRPSYLAQRSLLLSQLSQQAALPASTGVVSVAGVNNLSVNPALSTGLSVNPALNPTYSTGLVDPTLNTGLGELSTGMNNIGTGLNNLETGLGNNITTGINNVGHNISNIGIGVDKVNNGLNNFNANARTGISDSFNNTANNIGSRLRNGFNNFAENTANTADNVRSGISNGLHDTSHGLSNLENRIENSAHNAINKARRGFKNIGDEIKNAFH